ncbi:TRAP transporter substrate-binding protein [Zooshikella harenae]|uniref:TRAP transporter substrate-binding protein n=1 Tax=Zooshikella harenae TaxID=2827238 RepID=A0ABS5ZII9_9GAMM|nr:TRAP transporter substrate-binding protein [Zooshikella harenae]MBU2713899.1 TRAP transporter substrate-binding protein [Zooshikella harenae]
MRKLITTMCFIFSIVAGTLSAAPIEIKFSHVVAENTPKGKMAIRFKELVEQRLPGKVKVSVFPNAQLFNDDRVLEAIILGDVQLAAPSLSKLETYTKKFQIFDLPFLFDDMQAVDRFQQSKEGQKLLASLESKGLTGLGYLHNGMKQLSANDPLFTPADAKGKKFRIMASDVLAAQFQVVNANPVKKPFSEVFTLLQTKAIDGQENTWSNIYSKKFFEVQSHITETDHGVLDYIVVTSKEFWSGLPDEIRPIVEKSLQEAIDYGNKVALEKDEQDKLAIITSKKSKVIELSSAQRQQWKQAMAPVWKEFQDEIGVDLIKAAQEVNQVN